MDKNDPREGEGELRHLLVQAERQFWASGDALDAVIADIKDGKFGATKDLSAVIASLRKGLEAVFSERAKLEKYESDVGPRDGELDLGAARTEVRRRMDRLRTTFSPREISGGSDG
ncbi:hypothetical protein [Pararhodobacter sp.]|uniref:hypothetical protein n=1 Tax=Pararhodobacter sp. TaxID=2127056 RepID=UPI002AFE9783|nr:hypothetical protein [Pararhodobacter sp.]